MSRPSEATLADIFRAVFNLGPGTDVAGLTQEGRSDWDSLATVTLMTALESEFGIAVDPEDALDFTSFEAVLAYVRARVA
jgi:acyl carrier protein